MDHITPGRIREDLRDFGIEAIFVSDEHAEFAYTVLKQLFGDTRADSACSSREEDALTLELAFEVKRREVVLHLLLFKLDIV